MTAGYIFDGVADTQISESVVQKICDNTDVEKEDVVDILKTIECKRAVVGSSYNAYDPIGEYDLERGIIELLNSFIPSNLVSLFEEMKYYQIQTVLESTNPYEVIINL